MTQRKPGQKETMGQGQVLPPVPGGPEGRAALLALLRERSLLAALQALHARMGDIFRMSIPGFSPVVLAGPRANHFLLVRARGSFKWRTPTDPVTRLLGHGLLVEDGEEHARLRRVVSPALRRSAVGRYVPAMWARTEQVSNRWRTGQSVDMLPDMRRLALLILVDCLFGVDITPELKRIWPHLLRTLKYISPGPWLVWPGVPRPSYARSLRVMDRYLYSLIRARRASGRAGGDMLGDLIGEPGMSDRLVRDQLLTMLIAGHDTSTAHLSWVIHLLGAHPSVALRAREEVDRVLENGHGPPTVDQLESLEYLGQVLNEALRLYPPIHIGNRHSAEEVQFDGCRIPAGSRVMYSIYLAHRDPGHWTCPHRFDPARFSQESKREIEPYSYLPFGGGPRNCVGAAFAQLEAKAVLTYLLRHFEWSPAKGRVGMRMGGNPGAEAASFGEGAAARGGEQVKLYDIAILGGGAAGLSLAFHLSRSPLRDLSIVIVDKEEKKENDHTWCFWTRRPSLYTPALHRSWSHLRFVSDGIERRLPIDPYRYNMLRGADFYRFVHSHLAAHHNIELRVGQVEEVDDGEAEAMVRVGGEGLRARWVFDSRFPPPGYSPEPERYLYMVQHFLGWEVETSDSAFDPEAATLFDLRTEQRGGLCFFYILPHDERRALVEYTVFSTQPWPQAEYERGLRAYLEGTLGLKDYQVLGTERGVIPMTSHPFERRLGRRIMAVGTAGGMVKPSTGYAFARIQRDSRNIVRSLLRHGHPFAVPALPARYRLYDALMLDVMQRRPHLVKPIFTDLFTRNPPTRVIHFLDESSSLLEDAALLASLPASPFLEALWRIRFSLDNSR